MMHRINIFILSIFLALNPVFLISNAQASTTVGGWTVGDAVVSGATSTWNATKEIGGKIYSGVASIKPTPAQIGKGLARFGVGLAITAATQELLDGVDYVLDPANNSIRFKPKNDPTNLPIFYSLGDGVQHATLKDALSAFEKKSYDAKLGSATVNQDNVPDFYYNVVITRNSGMVVTYSYAIGRFSNPDYVKDKEKSVPIADIATKVLTDAENGDTEAQKRIAQVANTAVLPNTAEDEIVPPISVINQFEATAKPNEAEDVKPVPGTGTNTGTATDTATGTNTGTQTGTNTDTKPSDIPTDCRFFQTACDFFHYVETTYTDAVTQVKDYAKPETDDRKDTEVQFEEPKKPEIKSDYLQWSASCPFTAKSTSITIGDQTVSIDSDFNSWCDMASQVRPFVITAGSIASFMIITGVYGRGDE